MTSKTANKIPVQWVNRKSLPRAFQIVFNFNAIHYSFLLHRLSSKGFGSKGEEGEARTLLRYLEFNISNAGATLRCFSRACDAREKRVVLPH